MRLSQDELAEIIPEQFEKIHQHEMQKCVSLLRGGMRFRADLRNLPRAHR